METPQQRESLNAMAWTLAIAQCYLRTTGGFPDDDGASVAEFRYLRFNALATLWFRTR